VGERGAKNSRVGGERDRPWKTLFLRNGLFRKYTNTGTNGKTQRTAKRLKETREEY